MWILRFLFTIVAGLLCPSTLAVSGQEAQASHSARGSDTAASTAEAGPSSADPFVTIVVDVDGSVNPELIPDEVAFLHFFRVLASEPGVDQSVDLPRRVAYVQYFFKRECGPALSEDRSLDEGQLQRLLNLADAVAERVAAVESSPTDSGAAQGEDARRDREQIVMDAVNSMDLSIDPDAAHKIRRHVSEHVKRRIQLVRFSMPTQTPANDVKHHGQ
jgi:hypothetical protein